MIDTPSPIVLRVTPPAGPQGPDSASVDVCFHNTSDHTIRLLGEIEPVPVFFSFMIVDADGTPIPTSGGGKIDFGPEGPTYVEVKPHDKWCHTLSLSSVASGLSAGSYRLQVTYHNQYGAGCFRGQLVASPVDLSLYN